MRQRLETRETDLLFLLREVIYRDPSNPFAQLLRHAGIDYEDARRLVGRHGVEGALAELCRNGVYLTSDELAGRAPTVRGSLSITVQPAQVRNPRSSRHLPASTGSRAFEPGVLLLDLSALRDLVCDYRLGIDATGDTSSVKACWTVPGSGGIAFGLIMAAAFGAAPQRWFSHVRVDSPGLDPRYRLSSAAMFWSGRALGVRLPKPEYAPLDDPLPIARWIVSVLRAGRTPFLATYPTSAVRLCEAARDAGLELRGAHFSLRGEPITPARLEAISEAGVRCTALYGTTECGVIGQACLSPIAADEVHLHDDVHAMIQVSERSPSGLPPGALLMSSLRPTARLILLNVSMGDLAVSEQRQCGCPMESYGWRRHLHTIRSFEKLTGAGMTFADADVVPILEHVLPRRFGGTAIDYQLLEELGDSRAGVALVVHPRLGEVDEGQIIETFLTALAEKSETKRMMSLAWREARAVRVVRRQPMATHAGKVLHFRSIQAT